MKEEPGFASNQEQNSKLTVSSPADEYDSDGQNDISPEETDERKGDDIESGMP